MILPIARVNIHSKYVTGVISTAVMKDPIYPVLLGRRYVYLGVPQAPMVVAAMQTRAMDRLDIERETPVNPLPGEIRVAQNQDKTLDICFRKLPKAQNPPKPKEFLRKTTCCIVGQGKATENTTNW